MSTDKTYSQKRAFDATPEPEGDLGRDVDPFTADPGRTFVIHQHYATRLHWDLRLEMLNGKTPVLVSWAVPKGLPRRKGKPHLAIHVEDHPFDYGDFEGNIPKGNYGAGEVRIYDRGSYEVLEQEPGKLTFRLTGDRTHAEFHMIVPKEAEPKNWLMFFRNDLRDEPDPLPEMSPMLATLRRDAFDDERFVYEFKWDGVRALAVCTDETLLLSRNRNDITRTYPELARLHDRLVAFDAIVDGEIVSLHEGRPSFERLQSRINLQNPGEIERVAKKIPVAFIAFDLIYLDGRSLIDVPVEERKELLSGIVVPSDRIQVSDAVPGEGMALFDIALERRLEGIVAKRKGSKYRPGSRSKDWFKVKAIYDAELVIGGWSPGEGSRGSSFGALLMGAYEGDDLIFVGAVGTGFTEKVAAAITSALKELEAGECPFAGGPDAVKAGRFGKQIKNPRWVDPHLVAKVEFRELTSTRKLRAPAFKGIASIPAADATMDALIAASGG